MFSRKISLGLMPILIIVFAFLFIAKLNGGRGQDESDFKKLSEPQHLLLPSLKSPTLDTLSYDNNTALYLDTTSNTWTGVRFTPVDNFELQAIYFAVLNQYGNTTAGCSLYVVSDNGSGLPNWPAGFLGSAWVAPPVANMIWMQVDLAAPLAFSANEDFHIIYGPSPAGAYPGAGWWNLLDSDGSTSQHSYFSHTNRSTWGAITFADAFIRAGGEYTPGQPFHFDGVSGGQAPWTRLLRLQIDSIGNGTYSVMYPADRGTGTYTLLNAFTLNSTQLASLKAAINAHQFYLRDTTLYDGDAVDGSYCKLKIVDGTDSNTVETRNIAVSWFDSLVQEINAITPAGNDLIYNEIYIGGSPPSPGFVPSKKTVVYRIGCTIYVDLYIEFSGPCATQALANSWETEIENLWNNNGKNFKFGCCPCGCGCGCPLIFNVITKVRAAGADPTANYHQINVPCDNSADQNGVISHVHGPLPGPNTPSGSGDWDNNEPANTGAHEAGHLMGLDDQYDRNADGSTTPKPGHENDIMAALNGVPQQAQIDEIVNDAGLTCPWYCCPCFWFLFVADIFEPNNYDIYRYDLLNSVSERLTFGPAIDNHPDNWTDQMVWSSDGNYVGSNPEGDFEIYTASMLDVAGSTVQLTFDNIPSRHPHFHPSGTRIIYSSKRKCGTLKQDQCSIPVDPECIRDSSGTPVDASRYEGLTIIDRAGAVLLEIDLRTIAPWWPADNATNEGHASFSHDGSKILFSADTAGHGDNWEVYIMDYDLGSNSISNLVQVTEGPQVGSNPINMSAGAHYTEDDAKIIFSSTRTNLGNSQIFSLPASAVKAPVTSATRLTNNCANDYVPEPMCQNRIVFVSDRGLVDNVCSPCGPTREAPTYDLDLFLMLTNGSNQINLTNNDSADETSLIGDEVSWFCGIKPNLSPCTYYPKIWKLCWLRNVYKMWHDPTYWPNFPNRDEYPEYWETLNQYMYRENPNYWNYILQHMWDSIMCEQWVIIPSVDTTLPDTTNLSCCVTPGDANHSGIVNALDITFLINYLYKHGAQPVCYHEGDANGNGVINLLDITYLINYLYKHGPLSICWW